MTTNLALPGAGSLAAGRISGYAQLALAIGGMILSMAFGLRFILWYLPNWSRFSSPEADPVATLGELWAHVKWPLVGFGLFLAGWLWALVTSAWIIRAARKAEAAGVPPRLGG